MNDGEDFNPEGSTEQQLHDIKEEFKRDCEADMEKLLIKHDITWITPDEIFAITDEDVGEYLADSDGGIDRHYGYICKVFIDLYCNIAYYILKKERDL